MQRTWPSYLDLRSQVKVKGFTLEFRVRSISPEPFDQFSWNFTHMFLLVSWCVEHLTSYLNSRTRSRSKDLPLNFVSTPYDISWTLRLIFMMLHSYVPLSKSVCRAHDPATSTKGHRSRSKDLPLNFVSVPYLLNNWGDFQSNIPLIEIMCRTYDSAKQTQGQGHNLRWRAIYLSICVHSISDHIALTVWTCFIILHSNVRNS